MTADVATLPQRIKISTAAKLADMSVQSVYNAIHNDPSCPKPWYDEKGMARFMAHEWAAYVAKRFSRPHGTRVSRMQESGGAEKLAAYRTKRRSGEKQAA